MEHHYPYLAWYVETFLLYGDIGNVTRFHSQGRLPLLWFQFIILGNKWIHFSLKLVLEFILYFSFFYFYLLIFLFCFWDSFSVTLAVLKLNSRSGWPWAHRDPPASTSWVITTWQAYFCWLFGWVLWWWWWWCLWFCWFCWFCFWGRGFQEVEFRFLDMLISKGSTFDLHTYTSCKFRHSLATNIGGQRW